MQSGKKKIIGCILASAVLLSSKSILDVQAMTDNFVHEEIVIIGYNGTSSWTRKVATAVSVYAKQGTTANVEQYEDTYETGDRTVNYHYMVVTPSDTTIVQVDYAGYAGYLDEIKDTTLTQNGYNWVGSINAGFFENHSSYDNYGEPTGAVLKNGLWQSYGSADNFKISDRNNGFSTVYWTGTKLQLAYNGWQSGVLNPDKTAYSGNWVGAPGSWDGREGNTNTRYNVGYENAVSGAYTLYVDGKIVNLSPAGTTGTNYWNYGGVASSITLFGQFSDGRIFMLTSESKVGGDMQIELLRIIAKKQNTAVENAIRFDGGGSTQMCYDASYVAVKRSIRFVSCDVSTSTYYGNVGDTITSPWGQTYTFKQDNQTIFQPCSGTFGE